MARKRSYEEVKEMFEKEGYTMLVEKDDYKNFTTKIDIICNEGHRHSIYPKDFKNGVRCAKCRGLAKYTIEEVKELIEKEGYTLVSKEYKESKKKLEMICPQGHSVLISFYLFKRGSRCRRCQSSKGENTVRFILKELLPDSIEVKEQKSVMYIGNKYDFDFFIDVGAGLFIEYDGEQHFRPVDFWGGRKGFEEQKFRDEQKNRYVEAKKGDLLRIPYTKSKEEIYDMIVNFLSGKVDIKQIDKDKLKEAEYYTRYNFSINDVVNYYQTHTVKETVEKFGIHEATVRRYFRQVYGMSKKAYKKMKIREEMAEYYLTHTNKETQKKYNVSDRTLQNYFKEVYGTDKTSYLNDSTS